MHCFTPERGPSFPDEDFCRRVGLRPRKGRLPSQTDGLKLLVEAGIAKELPRDPWGTPYQYQVTGEEVTLTSLGSDGERGGTETAADITKTIKMR